jgi:uroporphyrinogen decarboxylase
MDEWRGATEGTRQYTQHVISDPEDWAKLTVLDPNTGSLGGTIQALQLITKDLGPDIPVIQTIFSPLSQAKNLVGRDNLVPHLRQHPDALRAGLQIIAESTARYVDAAVKTGIAGVFFAVQHAQYGLLSPQEYNEFGRNYDLQVLEAIGGLWLNMLHLHGENIFFDQFVNYPIEIINWHDQDTPPSLTKAKSLFSGVVCGGLKREMTMVLGTPDIVRSEARAAIEVTGGSSFILGTGCVTPITAPRANLLAARQSVEE